MKKILSTLGFLIFLTEIFCQTVSPDELVVNPPQPNSFANEIYVVDSIYCYGKDPISGQFGPEERTYNLTFDNTGFLLTSKIERYINDEWQPYRRRINELNSDGSWKSQTSLIWDAGVEAYYYDTKLIHTYDAQGRLIERRWENYNRDESDWEISFRYSYEYSDFEDPDRFLIQDWDNGMWVNRNQFIYTYNMNGERLSSLYQKWDILMSAWQNDSRSTNTLDSSGRIMESLIENWNESVQSWEPRRLSSYIYNNDGLRESLTSQSWNANNNSWKNDQRELNIYDNAGNNIQLDYQLWNGTQWAPLFRTFQDWDQYGNLIKVKNEIWLTNAWQVEDYCDYYYSTRDVVGVDEPGFQSCKIPNPVKAGYSCQCSGEIMPSSYSIISLEGKLIRQSEMMEGKVTFPGSLQPGLYFVLFYDKNKPVGQQKIIVQH